MKTRSCGLALCVLLCAGASQAQAPDADQDTVEPEYFAGTTAFILYNLIPDPQPPRYVQVNVGRQLTPRDALSVEAITWQYFGPLGRPYGPDFESEESAFPGRVRAYGIGLAYKRNVAGRVYVAVHATPMIQQYLDEDGERLQTGFQLFNSYRVGYDGRLLGGRVYIQPSVAVTNWPITTNLPESFQVEQDKWPTYFLFEPGLHAGLRF